MCINANVCLNTKYQFLSEHKTLVFQENAAFAHRRVDMWQTPGPGHKGSTPIYASSRTSSKITGLKMMMATLGCRSWFGIHKRTIFVSFFASATSGRHCGDFYALSLAYRTAWQAHHSSIQTFVVKDAGYCRFQYILLKMSNRLNSKSKWWIFGSRHLSPSDFRAKYCRGIIPFN